MLTCQHPDAALLLKKVVQRQCSGGQGVEERNEEAAAPSSSEKRRGENIPMRGCMPLGPILSYPGSETPCEVFMGQQTFSGSSLDSSGEGHGGATGGGVTARLAIVGQ